MNIGNSITGTGHVRHYAGHADETVHTTKADTDTPETSRPDNALTELLVAGLEREHGTVAIGNALMNLPVGMVGQTRIVRHKAEARQQLCNDHSAGLLTVHADSQGLDTSQEQEGIEWRESIANRIDHECNLL